MIRLDPHSGGDTRGDTRGDTAVTPTPINNSNKRDYKPFADAEKLARIVDQAIMQARLQRIYDVVRDYQVNDTTSIIGDDHVVDNEEKVEDEEEV